MPNRRASRNKPRLKAYDVKDDLTRSTSNTRPKRTSKKVEFSNNLPVRSTRNKGKRTIKYTQESSESEEDQSDLESEEESPVVSVSSRGRLRKMTPRARANLAS